MAPETAGLAEFLLPWLSFYGPMRKSAIGQTLGLTEPRLDGALAGLAESQQVVLDLLSVSAVEVEVCDTENLEILLRMSRRARRPAFKALPVARLSLFLAAYQGLAKQGD